MGLAIPQSKFEANLSRGSLSYDRTINQTNKQTPKQRLQLFVYRYVTVLFVYNPYPPLPLVFIQGYDLEGKVKYSLQQMC